MRLTKKKLLYAIAILLILGVIGVAAWIETGTAAIRTKMTATLTVIPVHSGLSVYCTEELHKPKDICTTWADGVVANQFEDAQYCINTYDWIKDTETFVYCLTTKKIKAP